MNRAWLDRDPHAATKLVRRHFKRWRRRAAALATRRARRLRVAEWAARRIVAAAFAVWVAGAVRARRAPALRTALERWCAWTIERQRWAAAKAQATPFRRYHTLLRHFMRWTALVELRAGVDSMVKLLRAPPPAGHSFSDQPLKVFLGRRSRNEHVFGQRLI